MNVCLTWECVDHKMDKILCTHNIIKVMHHVLEYKRMIWFIYVHSYATFFNITTYTRTQVYHFVLHKMVKESFVAFIEKTINKILSQTNSSLAINDIDIVLT